MDTVYQSVLDSGLVPEYPTPINTNAKDVSYDQLDGAYDSCLTPRHLTRLNRP